MMHKRAALRIAIRTLVGNVRYTDETRLRAALTLQRELSKLNLIFGRKRGPRIKTESNGGGK